MHSWPLTAMSLAVFTFIGSTTAIRRLQLKGLGGFAISPGSAPLIAAYVAEAKGSPGFVGIWDHAALPPGGEPPPPIARRSFFRVSWDWMGCI